MTIDAIAGHSRKKAAVVVVAAAAWTIGETVVRHIHRPSYRIRLPSR